VTSNRAAPIALVVLLVVGVVAVVLARRTDPQEVGSSSTPSITGASDLPVQAASAPPVDPEGWLNGSGPAPEDLEGKVVLYEFWTFGCSNCRAVLPHVKAWHDRYGPEGLVVLSIHTPEFDYEADPEAVAEFVEAEGIRYPVALDPDKAIWRSFENRFWPAFYLHDENGRRRLTHFGEGRYDETEDAIRALLGVGPEVPRAEVR
jgi:thiol-disulfide isomerase/thioredoxin